MKLTKPEILKLAQKYDDDDPLGTKREFELGSKIRHDKEIDFETLREIVEWKFYTLPGRIKRTMNLLQNIEENYIRKITRKALSINLCDDDTRIAELRRIKGLGISLASVILTFYDPANYCVYDIHVMREMYGKEPKYMFTSNKHYLRLLNDLRRKSVSLNLPVRTIEKALFKKSTTRI